jgi:hypothetical protein
MTTAVDSVDSAVIGSKPSKAHEREIGPYLAELGTSFNGDRWAASPGLPATVAAARLARDGSVAEIAAAARHPARARLRQPHPCRPNRLTPPKELPEIVKVRPLFL